MSDPADERRGAAHRRAQNHFQQAQARDTLVRQEVEKERSDTAAKTAKLKALRLAKEESDKQEAAKLAAERAVQAPKSSKAPAKKRQMRRAPV